MYKLTRAAVMISIIASFLFMSSPLRAVELGAFGDRIFQFQQKLADRGNVLAQYKLGTLYEFGISVPPDTEQAKIWYQKAAAKNYVAAKNRLIYLEIIKSGFDEQKHRTWFVELEELADSADANALILLGQMNHNGVHVETDLYSALDLLSQASSLGHTEVDSEIDVIKRKIEDINQLKNLKKSKPEAEAEKPAEPEVKPKAKTKPKQSAKAAKEKARKKAAKDKAAKAKAAKEEKRKRYEEVMRKLKEESQALDQQQEWAEEN